MLRLLRFLVFGDWHLHIWEDVGEPIKLYRPGVDPKKTLPQEATQQMKCRTCGKRTSYQLF